MGQRAAAALAALSLSVSIGAVGMPAPAMAASKGPSAYVAELTSTKGNNVSGSFTFKTVLNKSNQEIIEITADVKGRVEGCRTVQVIQRLQRLLPRCQSTAFPAALLRVCTHSRVSDCYGLFCEEIILAIKLFWFFDFRITREVPQPYARVCRRAATGSTSTPRAAT
jgi:hypothetical protein